MSRPLFGVIADDVTGACDVAGTVSKLGMSTVIILDQPAMPLTEHVDCVVIALKTRTSTASNAAASTVAAASWLIDNGATTLYQKYCSTFDSTDEGNIGPVAEALVDLLSARNGTPVLAVGTPATPSAGRTQYLGHLFVGERLLSESSLRNHPLTPMSDPDLVRVLGKQARRPVSLVDYPVVLAGSEAIADRLERHATAGETHVLVDSITDGDLDAIASAIDQQFGPLEVLVGGGAGLVTALARGQARAAEPATIGGVGALMPGVLPAPHGRAVPDGRRLILSGSSSERTAEQVAAFRGRRVDLDAIALSNDWDGAVKSLLQEVQELLGTAADHEAVLVTATASPDSVRQTQKVLGVGLSAELIEKALSRVASYAVDTLGVSHILVAGGETSGAIANAVGAQVLHVGELAAPGVPWTFGTGTRGPIALLLKSGNFGERDLFTTAWDLRP